MTDKVGATQFVRNLVHDLHGGAVITAEEIRTKLEASGEGNHNNAGPVIAMLVRTKWLRRVDQGRYVRGSHSRVESPPARRRRVGTKSPSGRLQFHLGDHVCQACGSTNIGRVAVIPLED